MDLLFQILIDLPSLTCIGGAYWTFTKKYSVSFLFFFDIGTEKLIISNNSKIIKKTLFGLEKFNVFDDKIACTAFKNLSDKERLKLGQIAQDFFSFLNQFVVLHKVKSTTRLYLVQDPAQNIGSDCCSVFQIFFYNHLCGLNNDSKILDHENLSKTLFRYCWMNYKYKSECKIWLH